MLHIQTYKQKKIDLNLKKNFTKKYGHISKRPYKMGKAAA